MKYLGFPLPELEFIYPICARGCRKIRDAEFLEDIKAQRLNCQIINHADFVQKRTKFSHAKLSRVYGIPYYRALPLYLITY